jgi:hypothetical protein
MKKDLRVKKLVLKAETLRRLEANQLQAAKGGAESGWVCVSTTIFSEGACEGYSWWYECEAN